MKERKQKVLGVGSGRNVHERNLSKSPVRACQSAVDPSGSTQKRGQSFVMHMGPRREPIEQQQTQIPLQQTCHNSPSSIPKCRKARCCHASLK